MEDLCFERGHGWCVCVQSTRESSPSLLICLLQGYAPLLSDFENFYTRRLYHRIQDCLNRPVDGPPCADKVIVCERTSKDGNKTLT
jgi:hypothetical protein